MSAAQAYDHSDRAPFLHCVTETVEVLARGGEEHQRRVLGWQYYRMEDGNARALEARPCGRIYPNGAGQALTVVLLDPEERELAGEWRNRREAERALRFAAAGMEAPEAR